MPTTCGFGFYDFILNYRVSHFVSLPNTYMAITFALPLASMGFLGLA